MNIWFISMDFHSACINCAWAFMGSSDLCCCLNYEHLPHAMASSNESIMDYGKLTSHATIRFHSARSGSAWLSFQLTFNCFHQFNSIACMCVFLVAIEIEKNNNKIFSSDQNDLSIGILQHLHHGYMVQNTLEWLPHYFISSAFFLKTNAMCQYKKCQLQ